MNDIIKGILLLKDGDNFEPMKSYATEGGKYYFRIYKSLDEIPMTVDLTTVRLAEVEVPDIARVYIESQDNISILSSKIYMIRELEKNDIIKHLQDTLRDITIIVKEFNNIKKILNA